MSNWFQLYSFNSIMEINQQSNFITGKEIFKNLVHISFAYFFRTNYELHNDLYKC